MRTQSKIDTTRIIGNAIPRNWNEVYQAPTDGFVLFRTDGAANGTSVTAWLKIYTGTTNNPTTFRAGDSFNGNPQALWASAMVPIKKGEYYKCTCSGGTPYFQAFFIPLV